MTRAEEDMAAAVLDMRRAETEAYSKALDLPGWEYRDMPNLRVDFMDQFKDLVGDENLRWITFAQRVWPDETVTQRGQVMISPEGMKRIADYNAALLLEKKDA